MSTYLEHVKSHLAISQARASEQQADETTKWRERLTPLEDRLAKLLTTIPPEIKNQGLSLPAIRNMLAGKWRGKCHPGELGAALRKLGYERRRNWSDGSQSFCALWFSSTHCVGSYTTDSK